MKLKYLIPGVLAASVLMFSGCSLPQMPWAQSSASDVSVYTADTQSTEDEAFGTVSAVPTIEPAQTQEPVEEEPASVEEEPAPVEEPASAMEEDSAMETDEEEEEEPDPRIDEILDDMTIEEKVAQMFIIAPEQYFDDVEAVTIAGDMTKEAFEETPVGGFIYSEKNLENEEQVQSMLEGIQEISEDRVDLPVFTAVEEEGGSVSTVSGSGNFDVPSVGDMSVIGASDDAKSAYAVGVSIGTYLNHLGFNLDLAPEADVLTNSKNSDLKYRSFGDDAESVSEKAIAVAQGLKEEEVLACAKYFPGFGATEGTPEDEDGFASIDKDLDELESGELVPYQDWSDADAGMIMVGNITMPAVIDDDTPASLSSEIITELLREEIGFDGIVMTDALNTSAITENYSSEEAAVQAIEAGADIILLPENFEEAYQGVLDAIDDGKIDEDRIDESVRRIIAAKLEIAGDDAEVSEDAEEDDSEQDKEPAEDADAEDAEGDSETKKETDNDTADDEDEDTDADTDTSHAVQ